MGLSGALRVLRERIGSAVFGSALDDGVLSVDRAMGRRRRIIGATLSVAGQFFAFLHSKT